MAKGATGKLRKGMDMSKPEKFKSDGGKGTGLKGSPKKGK